MKVCLYSRVSTLEQGEHGVSLDAQDTKNTAYASLYELEVYEVIRDAGESGKSLDRPGLQCALSLLRSGVVGGIVINKLDRLTRNIADWQDLIDDYFGEKAKYPSKLFSVNDSIDTRTAAGRLVLNVLLSVAQWEREAIGERTKAALTFKIKSGQRVGEVRYGYSLAEDGRTLIPIQTEQAGLALMRALRDEGATYVSIAAELDRLGFETKKGGPWHPNSVAQILKRAS